MDRQRPWRPRGCRELIDGFGQSRIGCAQLVPQRGGRVLAADPEHADENRAGRNGNENNQPDGHRPHHPQSKLYPDGCADKPLRQLVRARIWLVRPVRSSVRDVAHRRHTDSGHDAFSPHGTTVGMTSAQRPNSVRARGARRLTQATVGMVVVGVGGVAGLAVVRRAAAAAASSTTPTRRTRSTNSATDNGGSTSSDSDLSGSSTSSGVTATQSSPQATSGGS